MALTNVPNYIWSALIGAITIGFAVYVANHASPHTAGFLAALPVALTTMLFIERKPVMETSKTFALGISAYAVFALLFYSLITQNGWDHRQAIYFCVGGWLITAGLMWWLVK